MLQFGGDGFGNMNALVQGRQDIDFADQEQITDRGRVGNNLHWLPESLLNVSISL